MIRNVINFARIWNHGVFDGIMITRVFIETHDGYGVSVKLTVNPDMHFFHHPSFCSI